MRDILRVLTFRITTDDVAKWTDRHLLIGLAFTWLAGIGRYWDDPNANLAQHLGLGSVIYVFVLSAFLWALLAPLRPMNWSFRNLLTFVALTSPPALLYAIPVERFMSLQAARAANVWFLAIVAGWRVALLGFYLRRVARLPSFTLAVATLLPLTVIVTALTVLNLQHAVFDVMGGLRSPGTPHDAAYQILIVLTLLSTFAFPVLGLAYIGCAVSARRRAGAPAENDKRLRVEGATRATSA